MAEHSFYQLSALPVEKVLPRLLEKVYKSGLRSLIVTDSTERMQVYNTSLWTYTPGEFLPHGYQGDPEEHPIWIATEAANVNRADVMVLVDQVACEDTDEFKKCLYVYDGNTPSQVTWAADRLKALTAANQPVTCWFQSQKGAWEKRPSQEFLKNS